jgi:hypothetical protein
MITVLAASALLLAGQSPSIDDVVQSGFKDASFQVKVTYANQAELSKINKDFGSSYKFKVMDVNRGHERALRAERLDPPLLRA